MLRKARLPAAMWTGQICSRRAPVTSLLATLHLEFGQTESARKHPAKSEVRRRPLNMAKCARAHATLLKGPVCKCDQTRLIDKNRRARNLAPTAWRCEHSATPPKFFQRDYSFRCQRPHFILNCASNRTESSRVCFTCHSCHNLLLMRVPYEGRQSKSCIPKN